MDTVVIVKLVLIKNLVLYIFYFYVFTGAGDKIFTFYVEVYI